MEALRTQLDNLQWEVNRLGAENRRLRDGDPETSSRLDTEAELQQSKAETAELAERVEALEQQLAEGRTAAAKEEQGEAEVRARELAETHQRLEDATAELQRERTATLELQGALEASEARTRELIGELEAKQREIEDKDREIRETDDAAGRKTEALELRLYREAVATTKRWEAREQRLVDQMEGLGRELTTHKEPEDNVAGLEGNKQLAAELHHCEEAVAQLQAENETLRLEREEMEAELTYLRKKAKRLESELTISQRQDDELLPIIQFLETGVLPPDGDVAKRVVMTVSQYTLEDSVLYHVETDGTLRLIPPTVQRETLFHQAHSGVFGAHLGDCKVFSELRRHYWWCSMRSDVTRWTRGCLVCTTREAGRSYRAPLTPIPVGGPFDRVGVDIIQFPQSRQGNRYAVVFMDYLTKWPEVFPVPDQTAATVARLLVEEIVSRHGVPAEVLSDRGRTFLSGLMREVEELLGFHKTNTSAYHPQTDGLVERFNRTLTAMLAKTVEKGGKDWDQRLPYVLFAYRASQQQSTQESPFFLLYGRDPRLPTDSALCPTKTRKSVELQEYGRGLVTKMSDAWELARKCIGRAQQRQKQYYDKRQRRPAFQVGDRTFLFKPAEKTGEARKFARPFHGPFRVVEIDVNTAKVRRLDRPQEEPILVAIDRLRRCPEEIADDYWPPDKKTKKGRKARAPQTRQTESVSTPTGSDNDPSNVTSDDQVMPSIEEDLQLPSGEPNDTHEELDTSPAETEEGGARAIAPQSAHEKEEMPQPGGRLSNGSGGKWAGRLRGRPQAKKLDEDAHCDKGGVM